MYFQQIYRFEVDMLKKFTMNFPPKQSYYPDSPDICFHYPNSLFARLHSCFCNRSSCWFHYQNRDFKESIHYIAALHDRVHTAKQNKISHALVQSAV